MTPTLEDLEVELANRLRDVTADPNKPFVVDEIVNRLIPTTPSILGLVYASATTVWTKWMMMVAVLRQCTVSSQATSDGFRYEAAQKPNTIQE